MNGGWIRVLGNVAHMRSRFLLAAGAAASLVLVGCGESDPGGSSDSGDSGDAEVSIDDKEFTDETGSDTVVVDAVDNNFKPEYIEIKKGTTVEFINEGRNVHNVLPTTEGAFPEIPSEDFDPGDEGSITFDEVGDFPYYCSLHGTKTKGMVGGIRVVE